MITFSQQQIDSFNATERKLFDELVAKHKATVVDDENGFNVKAYMAKKTEQIKQDAEYQAAMEKGFC